MKTNRSLTQIFYNSGLLAWEGDRLATRKEYELADRAVGSIFESFHPGEGIELEDGCFMLSDDLDLLPML